MFADQAPPRATAIESGVRLYYGASNEDIKGNVGLIFTKGDLKEVSEKVAEYKASKKKKMAGKQVLAVLLLVVVVQSFTEAKEYVVGDEQGWTNGVDYTAWAKDKSFVVGDILVFNYKAGVHNIMKADAEGFESCTPTAGAKTFESGNDKITITSPGNKFYMCEKANHCESGQKLAIMVSGDQAAAPASPPTPGSSNMVVVGSFMSMVFLIISFIGLF